MPEELFAFSSDLTDDELGRQIKIRRDELGQCDRDIAEMAGVPPDTLVIAKTYKDRRSYERGKPARRSLHEAGAVLKRLNRKRGEVIRDVDVLERELARRGPHPWRDAE
jgi:hypothetical protein